VPPNASYIIEPSVEIVATATMGSVSRTATRTLTVDLTPPTADAGDPMTVAEGNTVMLNGSRSIDAVSYLWSKPTNFVGELINANEAVASFTAPDVTQNTTLTFSLTVTDGAGNAATDTVAIAITPQPLTLTLDPVAGDDTVNIAEKANGLTLTGTVEAGATTLTVTVDGEAVQSTINGTNWSATVPDQYITEPGFEVVVSASAGLAQGEIRRQVTVGLTALTANAGADQTVDEGAIVTLNGTGSSGDAALTYQWTAPDGVDLSSTTVADPTFRAPDS